jgi:hypothetical protein
MERTLRRLCRAPLVLLAVACGGDELNLPSEGDPGAIEALAGDGQTGQVGGSLPESLVVRVTDSQGRPIQGQPVEFKPTVDLTGQLLPDTVFTDPTGRAAARWRLGTGAGMQEAEARVVGAGSQLAVAFSATADAAPPDTLALVGGDGQFGQIGNPLPESLVVVLLDQFGNPIGGADIVWAASFGSLSSDRVVTGSDGRAAVEWTLGVFPGTQEATATYGSVHGSPVTFTAGATVGPAPRLVVVTHPSGAASAGVPFGRQPELQIQDDLGNPIGQAGVSVTASIASGGGFLGGTTTVNTDAGGMAQYADLSIGGLIGTRILIFAAPGHASATSTPIDVGAGLPSPAQSLVAVSPGTIPASAGSSSSTITTTARDDFGNPIAGAAVVISATGSGNLITQPGLTDATGTAAGFLSSTTSEVKSVSVRIANVALTQAPTVTVTPGLVHPASSTAVVPNGKILQSTIIVVTAYDQWGNRLVTGGATIVLTISGSNRRNPFSATDNGDGTYTASYIPIGVGTDTIAITLNGSPIAGSPFTSTVGL